MNINKVKKYYDSLINNSDVNNWYNDNSLNEIYNSFITMLGPNPQIIDLGCGSGSEAYKFSALGAKVFGVDCSERSVEFANQNNKDSTFIVGDITTDLSYRIKNKFDAATIILTLNNLSIKDIYNLAKNIKMLLKNEAYIFIIYKSSIFPYIVKYNRLCNKYLYSEKALLYIFSNSKYTFYKRFILTKDYHNKNYKCIVFKYFQ